MEVSEAVATERRQTAAMAASMKRDDFSGLCRGTLRPHCLKKSECSNHLHFDSPEGVSTDA